MTTNYKILGQTAPTASTETLNYTVPTATSTLVRSINITNTSATADTVNVALLPVVSSVVSPTFLAIAQGSTSEASSTDGITWTLGTLPTFGYWSSVTYGNGVFVAVAVPSLAATSTDGITWTLGAMPTSAYWYSVTYGNPVLPPPTSAANYIAYNNSIPGNATTTIKAGYTLPANAGIRVTSTNGTTTFSTFGAEIS